MRCIPNWAKNKVTLRYYSNGGTRYDKNENPLVTTDPIFTKVNDYDTSYTSSGINSFDSSGSSLYMHKSNYIHPGLTREWVLNSPSSGILQSGTGAVTAKDIAIKAGKGEQLKQGNVTVDLYANWANGRLIGFSNYSSLIYTFAEGMTWREWINSVYNTDGWEIGDKNSIVHYRDFSGSFNNDMWIFNEAKGRLVYADDKMEYGAVHSVRAYLE